MCEYCRTRKDIDGTMIPASPEPLISEGKELRAELQVFADIGVLMLNLDVCDYIENPEQIEAENEYETWKSMFAPISYCPVCGRKLSEEK